MTATSKRNIIESVGLIIIMALLLVTVGCSSSGCVGGGGTPSPANKTLNAFCGAASKPALDEAAQAFEKQTGIKVYLTYGGSGAVLSQMKISKSEKALTTQWPEFVAAVEARLAVGAREYGDRSFSRSPVKLIGEIRQELRDVAGWAFVLDCRLQRIADVLDDLAKACKHRSNAPPR